MAKDKKLRSDAASAQVRATQNAAAGAIKPPAHIHLRDTDVPFWNSIVRARARDHWNNSDLENAANLARCKADIERIQKEITDEGDVLKNDRGTQIVNPKHALLETLSRRVMALSRMLHVHAEATVGESRDGPKALESERESEEALAQVADDNLITMPPLH